MTPKPVNRELMMEWIVGVFMLVVLLALAYFTIVLGRATFFQRQYPLTVVFEDVMGLRKDDAVVVNGMTIGKIRSLRLQDGLVEVTADLNQPLQLRADHRIVIMATSILGGRQMQIEVGSPDAPLLPENVIPRGRRPYDLMEEAAKVVHEVRQALTTGGISSNAQAVVASLREITERLERGEGTLGRLLSDDTGPYTDLTNMVADLREASRQIREVSEQVARGEGTLGRLLADDSLYREASAIATNLRTVSERLAGGEGTLGKLLSADDSLYRDLSEAAASVKEIAGRMERGEGLLGRLSTDEALYEEARAALQELRAAVDDFRETSPVVSFTTLLFGAF